MPCLTTPRAIFNNFAALFADANRSQFLISAHRAALMADASGFSTFSAFEHDIGDVKRHSFLDDATLARLALWTDVFLNDVAPLNNDFADLRERTRNRSFLALILAGDDQNGITLFDIHLGEVERLFFFLFYCHLFPR
jgi:hypothetical protein